MGFTKIGEKWVNKDWDQVGSSSGAYVADENEEQADNGVVDDDIGVVGAYDVGESDGGNMGERITTMSPFERLMASRMHSFADEQRSHHEFCVARFQNMDEQIEVVQNQLFELKYGKEHCKSLMISFLFCFILLNIFFCLFFYLLLIYLWRQIGGELIWFVCCYIFVLIWFKLV